MHFNIAFGDEITSLVASDLLQLLTEITKFLVKDISNLATVVTNDVVVGVTKVIVMRTAISRL